MAVVLPTRVGVVHGPRERCADLRKVPPTCLTWTAFQGADLGRKNVDIGLSFNSRFVVLLS